MTKTLTRLGAALSAALVALVVLATPSWGHTPAFSWTCTSARVSAASYPTGTVVTLKVDGQDVPGSPLTLASPSYANKPAVLEAVLPGTGSLVTASIRTSDTQHQWDRDYRQETPPCTSPTPTPSDTPTPSTSPTPTATPTPDQSPSPTPTTTSPSGSPSTSPTPTTSPSPSSSRPSETPSASPSASPTPCSASPSSSRPSPLPSSAPTCAAPPSSPPDSPQSPPSGELPHTGARGGLIVALGLALLIAGAALVGRARRHRKATP